MADVSAQVNQRRPAPTVSACTANMHVNVAVANAIRRGVVGGDTKRSLEVYLPRRSQNEQTKRKEER